jgi:hypothetical protein
MSPSGKDVSFSQHQQKSAEFDASIPKNYYIALEFQETFGFRLEDKTHV